MDRGVDLLAPGEDVLTCGVSCWDQKIEKFDYRVKFSGREKCNITKDFCFYGAKKKKMSKKDVFFMCFFWGGG